MTKIRMQDRNGQKHIITLPAKYGVMKIRELAKDAFKYNATIYYYGRKLSKDNYKDAVESDTMLYYRRPPCKLDTKTNRCNRKPQYRGNKEICKVSNKNRCMKKK